jgi:hypothetical protein
MSTQAMAASLSPTGAAASDEPCRAIDRPTANSAAVWLRGTSFQSHLPLNKALSCKTCARERKNWNDYIQKFTEMDVFRAFGVL